MNDLVVVQLGRARTALVEAKTIQETKKILDVAAAAEIYAKRQQLSQESIDYAHSIKIEALAQIGRILKETPKNAGARGIGKSGVPAQNPTLSDLGLDKKTSSIAQKLADLPRKQLEQVKAGALAVSQAVQKVERIRQEQVEEEDDDIEDKANFRTSFLLRADQAIRFAIYSGPITREIISTTRAVADAWLKLANQLENDK